jgi:hypothetical protein
MRKDGQASVAKRTGTLSQSIELTFTMTSVSFRGRLGLYNCSIIQRTLAYPVTINPDRNMKTAVHS